MIWRWLLYSLAFYAVIVGLWDHDWRLILAGAAVAVIWPLISADLEHERELDRLWDDDDLADSA